EAGIFSSFCTSGSKSISRVATTGGARFRPRPRRRFLLSMHNRILVTGGAGFVGSSLCLAFKTSNPGATVIAFDNLRRRGSELNLAALRNAGVVFLHGDVRSPEDLAAAGAPDLIVECSAEPSAQAGYGESPEYLIHTNLDGCFHCLEVARRTKADFVFL